MNHSETVHPQSGVWLGALGVVVVLSFAALAVLAAATGPSAADAAAVGGEAAEVTFEGRVLPTPLYAGESGGHAPDANPPVPPAPRVTGLFDPH